MLQSTRKPHPFLNSRHSHTSVPLYILTPGSGSPSPEASILSLSHPENATLMHQLPQRPCLLRHSWDPWEAGISSSRVVHYLDSPISFTCFYLPNSFWIYCLLSSCSISAFTPAHLDKSKAIPIRCLASSSLLSPTCLLAV